MSNGMKKIPLTQGKFAIVDEQDYAELSQYRWHLHRGGSTSYARQNSKRSGMPYMHRIITKPPPGLVVHHRNHNGLDNRKENLCICTRSQHIRTSRPKSNGASKYKGVFKSGGNGKWFAKVECNSNIFRLGVFSSQVLAAKAYDERAAELFGEFAYLNFPHRLRKRNIANWLNATKGRVFAVTFIKRSDNSERTIRARIGVRVNQKGKTPRYNPDSKKLLVVFDMGAKQYKCIPIEGIEAVTCNGKRYRVD